VGGRVSGAEDVQDEDAWIETVIDAIPPKKWDAFIWLDGGGSREGRIDGADRRSLVRTIVTAYMDEIIGPPVTTEELRQAIRSDQSGVDVLRMERDRPGGSIGPEG
jgi:hypothetical protein